jgi:hypothetical protein
MTKEQLNSEMERAKRKVIQDSTMLISLYHGRNEKDKAMDDWGTQGPNLLVDWIVWTYGGISRINFHDGSETGNEIWFDDLMDEDMFFYDGVWYGDFSIQTINSLLMDHPKANYEIFVNDKMISNRFPTEVKTFPTESKSNLV